MTVKIADVIQPEVWTPYTVQRTKELSALFQSGIVQTVPEIDNVLGEGNSTINMPYWNDLTGDDEVLSDTVALTPAKITAGQDVAVQLMRGKAWGVNDLAAYLAGNDPSKAIADMAAMYWNRKMQAALVGELKGVFGVIGDTHQNNIAIEDGVTAGDTNKISGAAIVDTLSKLGDAHEVLTGIVMHSVPYFNLVKQGLIEDVRDTNGAVLYKAYLGRRVIVDDGVPVVAGTTSGFKYTTYLFGAGAIGYGEGKPKTPTETDRDSLLGEDILVNRKHYVLHPRGVKFLGASVAGKSPSNTELANAANWQQVYEDKAIRMVSLVTNG